MSLDVLIAPALASFFSAIGGTVAQTLFDREAFENVGPESPKDYALIIGLAFVVGGAATYLIVRD